MCHFQKKRQKFGLVEWSIACSRNDTNSLKGALSGLRHFLANESPLKIMKNAFYFTSKALFVLKILKFFSWLFGHVAKRLDKEDKINFKFYDVAALLTNDYNTHIAKYLRNKGN